MANTYINLYTNNPTAGGTDGTAISTDGTFTSPLTVSLNATNNESKKIKCAIRTEAGYVTNGNTIIHDSDDTLDRWKLCLTENGEYTNMITITEPIGNENVIFYAQASSVETELPRVDRNVKLQVTATITTAS